MASLGRTNLDVFPLCLGGNVFGWTADEPQSRAVLDAYVAAGARRSSPALGRRAGSSSEGSDVSG